MNRFSKILGWAGWLVRHWRRFSAESAGVAAVEFALILPFLVLLYLGTIETSRMVSVDKRVSSVAGALGDLVARTNGSLSTTTLNDYFDAASAIMAPYTNYAVGQIVSSVYVDEDGNTEVQWSASYNGATAHTVGASYDLPTEMTDIALDNYVIVSEAELSYEPMTNYVFDNSINLYAEFFYLPRFDDEITLN